MPFIIKYVAFTAYLNIQVTDFYFTCLVQLKSEVRQRRGSSGAFVKFLVRDFSPQCIESGLEDIVFNTTWYQNIVWVLPKCLVLGGQRCRESGNI